MWAVPNFCCCQSKCCYPPWHPMEISFDTTQILCYRNFLCLPLRLKPISIQFSSHSLEVIVCQGNQGKLSLECKLKINQKKKKLKGSKDWKVLVASNFGQRHRGKAIELVPFGLGLNAELQEKGLCFESYKEFGRYWNLVFGKQVKEIQ